MRPRGFTLIELMIVIAIIATIAAIAIPGLIRSRMAANETAAVAACKVFASAEELYRRVDYNGDGVLEYAQTLSGANSLFETAPGLGDIALVEKSFAFAEGDPVTVTARAGYVFRVLTSQGSNAEGGARSYLSGTHMLNGFAFCAVPNQYDNTGRNAFIISSAAPIYGKDRGTGITGHETSYNPDASWVLAQ